MQEKTLELNITHEILNLGVAFFVHHNIRGGRGLTRHIHPHHYWPFLGAFPIEYASGFHINLEGPMGGYDVALHCENHGGPENKVAFIQYKAPKYKSHRTNDTTNFCTPGTPVPHFQFKINTNNRQHVQLRRLSRAQGSYTQNHVLYALPMLKDMGDLTSKLGRLVRHTKFITIRHIDHVASHQPNTVDLAVGEHKILVGENNPNVVEVKSDAFEFNEKDITGDVIAEVITAIVRKNIAAIKRSIKEYDVPQDIIKDFLPNMLRYHFYQYALYLLDYFEVKISALYRDDIFYGNLADDFQRFLKETEQEKSIYEQSEKYQSTERDVLMFGAIFEQLSYILNANKGFDVWEYLPESNDNYLMTINKENNTIRFDEVDTKSIEQISYLLI